MHPRAIHIGAFRIRFVRLPSCDCHHSWILGLKKILTGTLDSGNLSPPYITQIIDFNLTASRFWHHLRSSGMRPWTGSATNVYTIPADRRAETLGRPAQTP
jgi:hypothetical protein